jgi:hypothetical protein
MSRAYRIKVRESLSRVLRASDHVRTQLEILALLPPRDTAALLAEELRRRGFEPQGDRLVRERDGVTVSVEATTGTVTVQAADAQAVKLEGERHGFAFDEDGKHSRQAKKELSADLQRALNEKADKQEAELQRKLTDRLEAVLGDIRQELDQVVNQVTAAALKRKAAQMGQIKEITEDPQTGSMTIVLEV